MDRLSSEARSENMAKIRNSDTIPEKIVRKYLYSKGLRYRKNDKRYPGKPDIVLNKYNTVIFVNGCFWHCHEGCKDFKLPKTNTAFWEKKLINNAERDKLNYDKLRSDGWNVIIIWECELRIGVRTECLDKLYNKIIK